LEEARQGGAAVIETMQGMAELAATIDELVVFHERLGLSSQRIHQITALIEKVAAQTNLLAINAAIQASQAGSYGEGFAVVAREMQSLSDNTGASAKEIGIAVEEVRIDIEGASALIEIGAEQARRGRTLAASAGEALERTVETSRTASEAMQSIAGDSTDQTRIAGEMASAFEKIGKMAIAVEEETGRHSKTSESIRQAVATLGAASQRVGSAIERHRRDGSEVSHAMEQIAETSQSNVETSVVLVEVTRVLEKQAETLSSLASFFRQPADNLY
jgi:twitching motility protein PilJ